MGPKKKKTIYGSATIRKKKWKSDFFTRLHGESIDIDSIYNLLVIVSENCMIFALLKCKHVCLWL